MQIDSQVTVPGDSHSSLPKVSGIGLNKTGTTTLAACLNVIGFKRHLSCRRDLLVDYFNFSYPHGVEKKHVAFYDRHNREVRDFFRENDADDVLLEVCWESGDGWKELCGFLGLAVPDVPFPHKNRGIAAISPQIEQENQRRIAQQLKLLAYDTAT